MSRKLRNVNVSRLAHEKPPHNWRFDLHSRDGTCWTIEDGLTRAEAVDRCLEFSEFSGLPATLHGKPITAKELEAPEE